MGYDDPDRKKTGQISLEDDKIKMEWQGIGDTTYYKQLNEVYYEGAKALGGTYIPYPGLTEDLKPILHGKTTISVHPLGGCIMGETGRDGVVNHKGQVFAGE